MTDPQTRVPLSLMASMCGPLRSSMVPHAEDPPVSSTALHDPFTTFHSPSWLSVGRQDPPISPPLTPSTEPLH